MRNLKDTYLASVKGENRDALLELEARMQEYYRQPEYHDIWIKGVNAHWTAAGHAAQLAMTSYIPSRGRVLEVGCGDGLAREELLARVPGIRYVGVDLNPQLSNGSFGFVAANCEQLPFRAASMDVVLSMFVIEHLVFPAAFLDEAWRVLRPGGRLIVIAPDFARHAMPSERTGLSYGSGREKLARGRILDALLTAYDTRVRIVTQRWARRRGLQRGRFTFPVLRTPRCLKFDAFTPDCDAVYPACPEEIVNYLKQGSELGSSEIFHRDGVAFGLVVTRAGSYPVRHRTDG